MSQLPDPDSRLSEVLRLATLLSDQVLDAQSMKRPVAEEHIRSLLEAALLLEEYEYPLPPMLDQIMEEISAVANVFDGLNVVASVTHYDIKYTKSIQPDPIGKTPTAVLETFANLFADYTIPTGPLRGFGFDGGVRYVGSSFAAYDNSLKVPDYVLYDATVHFDFVDGWRAAVTAANIGDKRFVSSCQNNLNCFYGEARRVLGSLSYKW